MEAAVTAAAAETAELVELAVEVLVINKPYKADLLELTEPEDLAETVVHMVEVMLVEVVPEEQAVLAEKVELEAQAETTVQQAETDLLETLDLLEPLVQKVLTEIEPKVLTDKVDLEVKLDLEDLTEAQPDTTYKTVIT